MAEPAEVFVSYSRTDKERVLEWVEKLRAAGASVWLDTSGIDAATRWGEQIVNALESAKVLLLMVSEAAVRSDHVAKEVTLVSERKGHILPVHLEPTQIPPTLRCQLAGIQHIECFKQIDDERSLQSLLRSLERIGVTLAPPPRPAAGKPAAGTDATLRGASPVSGHRERGALAVLPITSAPTRRPTTSATG